MNTATPETAFIAREAIQWAAVHRETITAVPEYIQTIADQWRANVLRAVTTTEPADDAAVDDQLRTIDAEEARAKLQVATLLGVMPGSTVLITQQNAASDDTVAQVNIAAGSKHIELVSDNAFLPEAELVGIREHEMSHVLKDEPDTGRVSSMSPAEVLAEQRSQIESAVLVAVDADERSAAQTVLEKGVVTLTETQEQLWDVNLTAFQEDGAENKRNHGGRDASHSYDQEYVEPVFRVQQSVRSAGISIARRGEVHTSADLLKVKISQVAAAIVSTIKQVSRTSVSTQVPALAA